MSALTIAEAAGAIGVSRARISQLLTSGELTGPPQPPGRRAPKNAPRVWRSSVEERLASHPRRGGGQVSGDERVRVDDLVRLKAALDVARDAIQAERSKSKKLASLLEGAVSALITEQDSGDRLERMLEELSSIVTTHIFPDSPEQVS